MPSVIIVIIMELHRALEPDWQHVPEEERTALQRVSAATNGVVTPGNVVTTVGLGMTFSASRELEAGNYGAAVIKFGVGRAADAVDGALAHATNTKSPVGESYDAVADKLVLLRALQPLVSKEVVSLSQAALMGAQNGVNTAASLVARSQKLQLHPSALGKQATAAQWGMIGFGVVSKAAEQYGYPTLQKYAERAGKVATGAYAVLGMIATVGYVRELYREIREKRQAINSREN